MDEKPLPATLAEERAPEAKPLKEKRCSKDNRPTLEGRKGTVATDVRDVAAFEEIMKRGDDIGSFASWAEKYADDTQKESGLSIVDRMIREDWRMRRLNVRYGLAVSTKEKMQLSVATVAPRNRMAELDGQLPPRGIDERARWKTALTMWIPTILPNHGYVQCELYLPKLRPKQAPCPRET